MLKKLNNNFKHMVYQLHHQVGWSYTQIANLLSTTICRRTVTRICKDPNNKLLAQPKKRSLQINRANKLTKVSHAYTIKNRKNLQNISKNQKVDLTKNNNIKKISLIKITSSKKQNTNINKLQNNNTNINKLQDNNNNNNTNKLQAYHIINNTNINNEELQNCLDIKVSYTNVKGKILSKETKKDILLFLTYKKQYCTFYPTITPNLTVPIFFDREFISWIIKDKAINYPQEFENFKNNQLITTNIYDYIKTFNVDDNIIYHKFNLNKVKAYLAFYYYKAFNFIVPETILSIEAKQLLNIINEHNWTDKSFHNIDNLKLTLQALLNLDNTHIQTDLKLTNFFLEFYPRQK